MSGLVNWFKNIGRAADAKAQEAADEVDAKNAVSFGKQELSQLKADYQKVVENIGSVKGEMAVLRQQIKEKKDMIKKHDADATALAEAGKENLAEQHCNAAETIEMQLPPLEEALKQQTNMLKEQESARDQLKQAVQQAEADLTVMKSMQDVTNANKKLSTINTDSSALAKFKQRKERMQKDMVRSAAMKEASQDSSVTLEQQTAAALGTGGGKARLARLTSK